MRIRFFRGFRCFFFAAIVVLFLTGRALAYEIPEELSERFGLSSLLSAVPEEAKQLTDETSLRDLAFGEALSLTPQALFETALKEWKSGAAAFQKTLLSLLALILLASLIQTVCRETLCCEAANVLFSVCVVLLLRVPLSDAIFRTASTLRSAAAFLAAYVPVYAAVISASGNPATASLYHVAVLTGAQVISAAVNAGLVPLCCVYWNLCIAESIAGDLFPNWSLAVKKIICWSLVLLVTAFSGILSLQSALTGAADGASVKTVKFLVGSFVPVIGSAITDAVQAAKGSIRIIRASAGIFGIAVTALTFLPSLLSVGLLRLQVGAASVLSGLLLTGQCATSLKSMGQLLSVLTALLSAAALLMIVSTAVVLTAGGAS